MRLTSGVRSRIRRPSPQAELSAALDRQAARCCDFRDRLENQEVMTQITVSLGNGAQLVALEQATYRARADERWSPGWASRSAGFRSTAWSCVSASERRLPDAAACNEPVEPAMDMR